MLSNNLAKTSTIKGWTITGLLLILVVLSSAVMAQKSKQVGDYHIHYVAYNSSFLAPEVAQLYGITRGKNIGLVNISIQKGDTIAGGVPAMVNGHAINMIQQVKHMDFKEINEGKAIYYISPFKFDNEDSLTFKFDVTVKETGKTHPIKWQQMFWTD